MSKRQPTLFSIPAEPVPRVHRAHVSDAGEPGCEFTCRQCGWESDWVKVWARDYDGGERPADALTMTEAKRGIPCPVCNEPDPEKKAEAIADLKAAKTEVAARMRAGAAFLDDISKK